VVEQLHTFLISTLNRGKWSFLWPFCHDTGEMLLVGCRLGVDSLERSFVWLPGMEPITRWQQWVKYLSLAVVLTVRVTVFAHLQDGAEFIPSCRSLESPQKHVQERHAEAYWVRPHDVVPTVGMDIGARIIKCRTRWWWLPFGSARFIPGEATTDIFPMWGIITNKEAN
jgi:hypothetical protein